MKSLKDILALGFLVIFFACSQKRSNEPNISIHEVDVPTEPKEQKLTPEEKRKKVLEEDKVDSLRFQKTLIEALEIASKNLQIENYFKKYETQPDDSSFTVAVNM